VGFLLLLLAVIGLIYYLFFGYYGQYGFDDLAYARLAHDVFNVNFHLSVDHFSFRWGVIMPSSLVFKIFGMNDHSGAIPPLLATLATTVIVLIILKNESFIFKLLAVALLLTSQWVLHYSDKIMPDIHVMFYVTAMIIFCIAIIFLTTHQNQF